MRGINFTHTWGSESKHSVLEQPDKVQSWGRAVDVQTVHMYRNLRKAIVKWTIDSKEPIPEMKYIKPSLVAVWNSDKYNIDSFFVLTRTARTAENETKWQRFILSL